MSWLTWLQKSLLQPRDDERLNAVAREVQDVKRETRSLTARVEAIEAFNRVAGQ